MTISFPAVPGIAQPGQIQPGSPGSGPPIPPGPNVVQQVTGTSYSEYGLHSVEMTTTNGNFLVVYAGWNRNYYPSPAATPAAYVSDSAGNKWYHLGTSTSANSGSRSAIWCCPNARPVKWISCSLTSFATSLAYLVVEFSSFPSLAVPDLGVTNSNSSLSATSLSMSGTPAVTGIGFTCLAAGATGTILTTTPFSTGWTPLNSGNPISAGTVFPGDTNLWAFWKPTVTGATTVTYGTTGSAPLSGVLATVQATPTAPTLKNPKFPLVKVEMAFGFTPGDPSSTPPAWTDITSRCIGPGGTPAIEYAYGRPYELGVPEAGELTIDINNADGAFTPGNTASPFYPHVVLGTPVRVSAFWAGAWYDVAYGYVERWPQEWPDLPQWGFSKMVATDSISVLAATTMPSALEGELLLDAPYAYFPCSEQYSTTDVALNTTKTASSANGLLCANASRTNQRSATYFDGNGAVLETGLPLNLLGDQGTGAGTTGYSTSSHVGLGRGPGAVYVDPNLPSPLSTNGATTECFFTQTDTFNAPIIMGARSNGSPYGGGRGLGTAFEIQADGQNGRLQIFFADWANFTVGYTAKPVARHLLLNWANIGGIFSLGIWLDGNSLGGPGLSASQVADWNAFILGSSRYGFGRAPNRGNYAMAHMAVYSTQLTPARISAHYNTGFSGGRGDYPALRVAKILSWGNISVPRGGPITKAGSTGAVFMGPAYSVGGSAASDALNAVTAADGGLLVSMPSGILTYLPRWWLYNVASTVSFGDVSVEVPYLPPLGFDYDNTYLYNTTQISRVDGPNSSITAAVRDQASQNAYFPRTAFQQTIETTSDQDAYDASNWYASQYGQPALRAKNLVVDAASNPVQAFPVVLTTRVGDVGTVDRHPVGGAALSELVQVQRVQVQIGPGVWQAGYETAPYVLPSAVLTLDTAGQDVLGNNALGR